MRLILWLFGGMLSALPLAAQPAAEQANDPMYRGAIEFQQGHRDEAVRLWQQALAAYRAAGDIRRQAYALENLGTAAQMMNDPQQALGYFSEALPLARRGGDARSEISILGKLGQSARTAGDAAHAADAFRTMLARAEAAGDRDNQAYAAGNLGRVLLDAGQPAAGAVPLRRSVELFHQLGKRRDEGLAWFYLGRALDKQEDYLGATDAFQQAVTAAHETKNASGEAEALFRLGHCRYLLGDYDGATLSLNQSLLLAKSIGDKGTQGSALLSLGSVQYFQKQPAQAVTYFEQALDLARATKDRELEGEALGNLGLAYTHLGERERAADYYHQDIDIARERGDKLVEAQALGNLATLRLQAGAFADAIPLLEQSRDRSRTVGYRRGEAIALRNLGLAQWRTGNTASAESTLRTAIAVQESLREPVGRNDLLNISLFETQLDAYRYLQAVLIAQKRTEAALEVSERGRAQALAQLLTRQGQTPGPIVSPDIAAIRAVARTQNVTLLEYSLVGADQAIYLWVVRPDGSVVFRRNGMESHGASLDDAMAGLVQEVRQSLGALGRQPPPPKPGVAGRDDMLGLFYRMLIAPVADLLPDQPDKPVVLIPQGGLFLLPFAALRDPDGHPLVERHALLMAPSIATLGALAARPMPAASGAALVAGNPIMPVLRLTPYSLPAQLPSLPGAASEAEAVARELGTSPLLGEAATKQAVLQAMPKARIVHLATHGLLDDMRSEGMPGAVVLGAGDGSDGLLTTAEIGGLRIGASLVVLSACDTGEGRISGDGVVGLARAFLGAGAGSVLVSLWSVPDQPTAELMVAFYRAVAKAPGRAQALRQAMLETRTRYADPIAWAAFILMGSNQ
jgi:CHAT domain-containing protein